MPAIKAYHLLIKSMQNFFENIFEKYSYPDNA